MKTIVTSQMPVMALEIDEEGTVAQKSMQLTRQGQLGSTLLDALYPGIRVATVEIPGTELDDYGRAKGGTSSREVHRRRGGVSGLRISQISV